MESDLAMLRGVNDSYRFVSQLEHVCAITLTEDFWTITLPNELATSSTTSPSLATYEAAQVILDAPALFSREGVGALSDPSLHANRSALERHHLWPANCLAGQGITDRTQINQVANLASVEWSDNIQASDKCPAEYLPALTKGFSDGELAAAYEAHALPPGWESLDYETFLRLRRELMAEVVHRGYGRLSEGLEQPVEGSDDALMELISGGESDSVEFKSTLRVNLNTGEKDGRMEHAVLKTLAAFLNTGGGTLVIGVADDGTPVGIEKDLFQGEDKMSLHLTNLVKARMGDAIPTLMHQQFDDYPLDGHEDSRVLKVSCERSPQPVYLQSPGSPDQFFVRTGPSTTELYGPHLVNYVKTRFGL